MFLTLDINKKYLVEEVNFENHKISGRVDLNVI